VVIGTSSGGVEALSVLLPALPSTLRPAVLIVLHLPRDRPSRLVDIFAPKCAVPVCEAEDKAPIRGGVVYFAPPDYHVLLESGPTLALSADDAVNYSRPSIDVLFESAADVYGPHLLGIILTGASRDGAVGLDTVRRAGGCTIVQRPDTAQARVMTDEALKLGPANFVLTLSEIATVLGTLDRDTLSAAATTSTQR
jgi:two-component system chemotaxis response regulator CheB